MANDDFATVSRGSTITVNVLANDVDVDGDTLRVLDVHPIEGTATINRDNTITYTPDPGFIGRDPVLYLIFDGQSIDSAVLFITVQ